MTRLTTTRPLAYRITDLAVVLHVSRQTIYQWERNGLMPRRIELSPGVHVWRAADIDVWLASRPPVMRDDGQG